MADSEEVFPDYEFQLNIGGGEISVQQHPRAWRTELSTQKLGLNAEADPFRKSTIEALVNMLRENRLSTELEFMVLGAKLYAVLFQNDIGEELHSAINDKSVEYLRIVLVFDDDDPDGLVSWPWEYLYSPPRRGRKGYWLAQVAKLVLTRHIVVDPIPPVVRVDDRPIKVLFIAASPRGEDIEYAVDHTVALQAVESLDSSLRAALQQSKVMELKPFCDSHDAAGNFVPKANYEDFKAFVYAFNPHIIHFVGHGKFERGHGRLAFTGDKGTPDWVRDIDLAGALAPRAVPNLRLVVLQACESGRPVFGPPSDSLQASSGLANALAGEGVPAVVAMQYQVKQEVADVFVTAFYGALGRFESVDAAVAKGRLELWEMERKARDAGEEGSGRRPAFGLPMLYLSKSDSLILRNEGGRTEAAVGVSGAAIGPLESRPERQSNCPWCGVELVKGDINYCTKGHYLRCPNRDNDGRLCDVWITEDRTLCGSCGKPLPRPDAASVEAGGVVQGGFGEGSDFVEQPTPPAVGIGLEQVERRK